MTLLMSHYQWLIYQLIGYQLTSNHTGVDSGLYHWLLCLYTNAIYCYSSHHHPNLFVKCQDFGFVNSTMI